MLVNQRHMIKAGTKRLDFVLGRDYLKPEHYQKTHISFVQDKGIEIASTGSIEIEATEESVFRVGRWIGRTAENWIR